MELLDFIYDSVEGQGDNFDKGLPESKLADYFGNFLMEKDFVECKVVMEKIDPQVKMKHSIQFFLEIVGKIPTKF